MGKFLKLFVLGSLLFSCSTRQKVVEEVKPTEVVEEKSTDPSIIKRQIVDTDLKKSNEDRGPKKRIVVLPFLDKKSERSEAVLKNAENEFINQMNKTDEVVALDSSTLKLDFSKFTQNNDYDIKAIAKESQNAGVSALLQGKVIDVRFKNFNEVTQDKKNKVAEFEIVVEVKMISVRSEQELFHTVKTVTIKEENTQLPENITSEFFFKQNPDLTELLIKDAFVDFTQKIIESLQQVMWEGRIAALQGEKIYLNVGKISGVQVGDILKVVEDGNEIYDPEIGYHIGKVPGRVKGTLEIVNYFGQDGAVSVIHSGAGFKENDRVELYQ